MRARRRNDTIADQRSGTVRDRLSVNERFSIIGLSPLCAKLGLALAIGPARDVTSVRRGPSEAADLQGEGPRYKLHAL
jgi:hypothetical protein